MAGVSVGSTAKADRQKDPAAEWVAIDDIKPCPRNPRSNRAAVEPVARSIATLGFGAPIVCRATTRVIIAGHTRWLAAKALGLESVPVRFMDVTEEQAAALMLADNKLGEIAEWDDSAVADILSGLDRDLVEVTGFDTDIDDVADDQPLLQIWDDGDVIAPSRLVVVVSCETWRGDEIRAALDAVGVAVEAIKVYVAP